MSTFFIATNVPSNQCSSLYCISLSNSVGSFAREGGPGLVPILLDGHGNSAMAFNRVITWAHRDAVEGIFLIGPNMGWDPGVLQTMIASDKDVLAAPVYYNHRYLLEFDELSRTERDKKSGEIKVQTASLDFLFLRKSAIDALCEGHPTVQFNGEEVKMVLQSGDIFSSYHTDGEILAFRLREAGFHIWVDPSLRVRTSSQVLSESNLKEALEKELQR